ncbi:MAG TPA: ribosome-binding factor A [Acidimicrobiales bacterium]|nr:ribosome-binding factor A [Acidimicrobiales bacterium]
MPSPRPNRSSPRYPRTYRLNQVLREVLAEELERLAERDDQLLTITGVTVEADLRNATVWLASLPDEAAERLEADRVALQAAVARQTRLKRTPRLSFRADPAVVAGSAIEDAIRRIRQEPEVPSTGGDPSP